MILSLDNRASCVNRKCENCQCNSREAQSVSSLSGISSLGKWKRSPCAFCQAATFFNEYSKRSVLHLDASNVSIVITDSSPLTFLFHVVWWEPELGAAAKSCNGGGC